MSTEVIPDHILSQSLSRTVAYPSPRSNAIVARILRTRFAPLHRLSVHGDMQTFSTAALKSSPERGGLTATSGKSMGSFRPVRRRPSQVRRVHDIKTSVTPHCFQHRDIGLACVAVALN